MSEQTNTSLPLAGMKYNELKALAAEKGLDASGTKEDLIARLSDAGIGAEAPITAPEESNEGDNGDEPEAPQPPQESPKPKAAAPKAAPTVEELHRSKALRTKAALDKQPKVMVLIPFEAGENPETAKLIKFHIGINGYSIDIPRGTMVEVPVQVAQMVRERLESEGRMGREHLISADPNRAEALS